MALGSNNGRRRDTYIFGVDGRRYVNDKILRNLVETHPANSYGEFIAYSSPTQVDSSSEDQPSAVADAQEQSLISDPEHQVGQAQPDQERSTMEKKRLSLEGFKLTQEFRHTVARYTKETVIGGDTRVSCDAPTEPAHFSAPAITGGANTPSVEETAPAGQPSMQGSLDHGLTPDDRSDPRAISPQAVLPVQPESIVSQKDARGRVSDRQGAALEQASPDGVETSPVVESASTRPHSEFPMPPINNDSQGAPESEPGPDRPPTTGPAVSAESAPAQEEAGFNSELAPPDMPADHTPAVDESDPESRPAAARSRTEYDRLLVNLFKTEPGDAPSQGAAKPAPDCEGDVEQISSKEKGKKESTGEQCQPACSDQGKTTSSPPGADPQLVESLQEENLRSGKTAIFTIPSSGVVRSSRGTVELLVHKNGRTFRPHYNAVGMLTRVDISDGFSLVKSETSHSTWQVAGSESSSFTEEEPICGVAFDKKGNLWYETEGGKQTKFLVDGSVEVRQKPV